MKRCPECFEAYEDHEQFCEVDGQKLLGLPLVNAQSVDLIAAERKASSPQREAWLVGAAGVVLGIVICASAYMAIGFWTDDSESKETSSPVTASQGREASQSYARPRAELTPEPEESPSVEPEASPEPSPAPSVEAETLTARLNQGPVSTGARKKEVDATGEVQTIIQMNDGSSLEVDAAWEDGQGVWYRRGGMVAFLDSQRVKAIVGRAAQKSASGSNQ
jgi:hypothetical protein